jgi:hypothetical protein
LIVSRKRPLPDRPRFTVRVTLGGIAGTDAKQHYAAFATFRIDNGQTYDQELAVPAAFVAYRVTMQCVENRPGPPNAEREFAKMVIDAIPRDVWDAGIAAIAARDRHGQRTAQEIIERWRQGEYDAAR